MKSAKNRDLLVLLKNQFLTAQALEQEVECLNNILLLAESETAFCRAHELVIRYRITQKPRKILDAIRQQELKPFHFLVNKN